MSRDAFPKIRLCTVVRIQSGISPGLLCTSWRIHRAVSCNKKGYFWAPRLLQWKILCCFQPRGFLLAFRFCHFLYFLRVTASYSEKSRLQCCWSVRAHGAFSVWVETSDPRAGYPGIFPTEMTSRFLILAPGAPEMFFGVLQSVKHLCPTIKILIIWECAALLSYVFGFSVRFYFVCCWTISKVLT